MEQKIIHLSSSTKFSIAVESLRADLAAATAQGVLEVGAFDDRIGAPVRYMDQVIAKLAGLGSEYYRGVAIFDRLNIWNINSWGNDYIFDMTTLLVTALSSRFVFPKNLEVPSRGDWLYGDMVMILYSWLRVPQGDTDILPLS